MQHAISVQGLGKKYLIGHQSERERYSTFRDQLGRNLRGLVRSAKTITRGEAPVIGDELEEFWALRDVEFNVTHGEVVGVIGRNGAGKSTLLKVLSRITEPSAGRVELRGRVASLLEVGTGFHPELTGRENIFLNGAILGMSAAEIRGKFDEIVAFAEVERFLDTPVKRYSSGMYVRLAFAVAAHLEPEILIVDEVLAVGDAEFQRKCLGKLQDVAGEGRTVLFVSHNMAAVEQLCTRAFCLEGGRIALSGDAKSVISQYFSQVENDVLEFRPRDGDHPAGRIDRIAMCDAGGAPLTQVSAADKPSILIDLTVEQPRPDVRLAIALHDVREAALFASCPPDGGVSYPSEPGRYRYIATVPWPIMMPQRYSITASLYSKSEPIHVCAHALSFDVMPALSEVLAVEPNRMGALQLRCDWAREFRR